MRIPSRCEESDISGWAQDTIFTIGHSTRAMPEFIALLDQVQIRLLADVRSVPGSRANPQFNGEALHASLTAHGIDYCHIAALGGLRHRPKNAGPSPNGLWQNASFRNYADYAGTAAFRAGLEQLLALARDRRTAIMCAEAVWWRCHRRIIADYLLAAHVPVGHIMGPGKIEVARLTPGAQVLSEDSILYPAPD